MEGFLSINWDKAADTSSSFFPKDVFDKSSAAYHSLHEIPQSPWPLSQNQTQKTDGEKWNPCSLKREVVPGVNGNGKLLKIQTPVPFLQKSILNELEQKDYLYAVIRVMKAFMIGTPTNPADFVVIKETQKKLTAEIQEFQKMAQNVMHKNPFAYSILNPGIAKYANEAWRAQLVNVEAYPPYYKLVGNVTLIPKENLKTLDMVLEQTLLELGRIPAPIFPALNTLIKFQRITKLLNNRFPATELFQIEQVSKDANAIKLTQKHQVDVIISSNTLRSLAGSVGPLFRYSWDIPFTVSEMNVKGEQKKVIFVDDPLPPLEMTAIEKNSFFYTWSVKNHFLNANRSRYFVYPGLDVPKINQSGKSTRASSSDDIFGSYDIDVDSVETFGVERSSKNSDKKTHSLNEKNPEEISEKESPSTEKIPEIINQETTKNTEHTSSDSDSSETSLVINTVVSPKKKFTNTENLNRPIGALSPDSDSSEISLQIDTGDPSSPSPPRKKTKSNNVKSPPKTSSSPVAATTNLLNVILQDQEKMMQSNRKRLLKNKQLTAEQENPLDYTQPKKNQNVTYRTWALRANEKSLRLLVRSSVDAAVVTQNEEFRTFMIVPKTEYQPWYGAECMSPRELNEQWIDLHLRPESRLIRARLDAYTGDLMMAEQKDKACFDAETNFQYGDKFKPANCLQNIWAVLSSLCEMDLSPGSFLLRHGFYDGICVQVWNSTDKESSALDLHQTYAAVDTTINAIRDTSDIWLPLDPLTVLPIQRALNRPPLTFQPTDEDSTGSKTKWKGVVKNKGKKEMPKKKDIPKKKKP